MKPAATEQRWGHRYAFLLAATASAVGLGNIWKFPYVLGENGVGRSCSSTWLRSPPSASR